MVQSQRLKVPVRTGLRNAYFALPEPLEGRRPAVLVIHEIWGLTDHIREVADRFAGEGYAALAPQLYDDDLAEAMEPSRIQDAMTFLRSAPPEVQRDPSRMGALLDTRTPEEQRGLRTLLRVMDPAQRAQFALDLLAIVGYVRSRPEVDPKRVASLGFCMGGGLSARLATLDPDLKACVVFYGESPDPDQLAALRANVLGLYGGEDHRITDGVPAFAEAMRRAGRSFSYHVYPGAKHAFFNEARPQTYDPGAAADAWRRTLTFLRANL